MQMFAKRLLTISFGINIATIKCVIIKSLLCKKKIWHDMSILASYIFIKYNFIIMFCDIEYPIVSFIFQANGSSAF